MICMSLYVPANVSSRTFARNMKLVCVCLQVKLLLLSNLITRIEVESNGRMIGV